MSALGESGNMIPTVTQTQIFNWVPGMGTTGTDPNPNFKVLNAVVRPQVGLAFNAGLGGKDSSTVFLHVRGDGMDSIGLLNMAVDLEKIAIWMMKKSHWDTPVGKFRECL
jgi:hypothetical protein